MPYKSPHSLSKSFFIIFIPLFAILAAISITLFIREVRAEKSVLQTNLMDHISLQRQIISEDVSGVESDLLFLSDQVEMSGFLEPGGVHEKERLAKEWLAFSGRKSIYDHVGFIDENGMEVIRVNFNNEIPSVVPDKELRDKKERLYFGKTFSLKRGEVFVSPFDLNMEGRVIKRPFKPMIRFGTPVFDSKGRGKGVVILDYLGNRIIQDMEKAATYPAKTMLVNAEGYWLHSPNEEDEWGFMFGNRRTFGNSFPGAWDRISRDETGQFDTPEGIFTFATVYPVQRRVSGSYCWKIVSYVPPDVTASGKQVIFRKYLLICGTSLCILIISSWYITRADVRRRIILDELIEKKHEVEKANLHLVAANKELKSIERLKNEFLQTISHELRSPLSPILSYLEMLREGDIGELSDVQREVVREMRICGKNMQMIIDQLLDVANIQAGRLSLEPADIDLNQLLMSAVYDVREYADERKIEFEIIAPPGPFQITGDRDKLYKVFMHLLRNAVKFNRDGGRITVEASRDDVFEVTVSDTGIGIPADQIQRIFEGFTQVNSSATRQFWGVGLGLYLVKRLVELHKGGITVESEPEKGSRFTVLIPREQRLGASYDE